MTKKAETISRAKIMEEIKKIPNSWFESISQRSICATPDVLGCVNGIFVALEFKKDDKEKPTKLQQHKLEKIKAAHGWAFVVHPGNWKDVHAQLLRIGDYPEFKEEICSH